jgi:integrase
VNKKIGWHSFRHGLSNQLRQNGVEIKTAQELLRHANSRITLDIYQRSLTKERRAAQAIAVKGLLGE